MFNKTFFLFFYQRVLIFRDIEEAKTELIARESEFLKKKLFVTVSISVSLSEKGKLFSKNLYMNKMAIKSKTPIFDLINRIGYSRSLVIRIIINL
jgi:hypothetical protein